MQLDVSAQDSALPLIEGRRRHLEKLRWQLRVARRAVAATRKQKADCGELDDAQAMHTCDLVVVFGFFAGGAAASLLTAIATQWMLS